MPKLGAKFASWNPLEQSLWLSPAGELEKQLKAHSAFWTLYSLLLLCKLQAQTLKEPTSLWPPPLSSLIFPQHGWVTTATGRPCGRNNASWVFCSVTMFHWVAESFTINIVRDMKSMQTEGSSGGEKALLVTQKDPWICPGITQLRKQSDFKSPW